MERLRRRLCKHSEWSVIIGVLASFLVSGLSHELLFYHVNGETPTGQVTCFFVFHGVCLVAEGAVKKVARARGWVMKPVVSQLLTVGFLVVTSGWLLFPLFKRNGMMDRFANESLLLLDFIKRQLYM
ncbi:putative long-chain-alcohol O-fatty-acyltransferase 3 [Raphanus sativus]|nr:putative long-chain-alcohol O-fatty-acyltransferase 3 [Raphanus sativus]